MAKIVNVPGVGNYAVPDNATQQQIDNFIRNVSANGGLKAPSAPPPEEATGQGGIPLVSPLLSGAATGIAEIPLSIYGLFDKEGSQGARKATYDVIQRGLGMNPEAQPTTTESVLGGIGSLVPMLGASVLTEGAATPLLASRLGLGGARALTAAEEAAAAAKLASQATIARTAGGAAAAIPLGMGQGQQMVQQYEEQTGNKLTPGQYTAANLLSGAVGAFDLAPLERWAAPVAKLLEKVPASESIAASKIVNNEKSKFLMEVAKGAGMEGGQEAVSQIAQNLVAAGIYNPDQDITESVASNFSLGAGVGGMVEAAVLGATGIKNRRMAARNAQLLGDANNTRTTARAAIEQGKNVPNASDIAGLTPAPSPISRPLGDIATDIKNTNAELDQARQNLQFFQATSPNTKRAIKGQTIDLSTLTEPEVRDLARRLKIKPSQDADLRTAITEKTNPERITQELLRQKVDTLQARSNSLQRSFDIGASTGSSAPRENVTGSRFRVAPAPIATHELSPVAKSAVYGNVTEAPADDIRSVADAEIAVRAALSKKEIAGPRPDTDQMSDPEIAALINAAKIKVQKNEDPRMAVRAATDNVIKRGILKQELDAIRQKAKEQDRFAVVEDQFDSEGKKIGEAVINRHRDEAAANESAQLFNEAADPLKYQARVAPIGRALRNVLTGMNLPDVGIQLQQRIGNPGEYIEGQYDPAGNLIQIATGLYKPGMTEAQLEAKIVSVMHHEIIHSLKEMGVFKPHEWNRLLKAIGSQKMHGKLYTPLDWVTQLRTDLVEKAMNGDESAAEELHEEAVAEMFRDWMANGRTPTPVGGLLSRILNIIKRIVGVSRTHKAEGIFRAIASGKIGARERVAREAPQVATEAPSAPSAPTTAAPVETAPSAAPVAPEEPVIKGMRFAPRPSETGAEMAPAPSPVDLRLPPSERVSQAAGIAEAARPVWERSVSGPMAPEIAPAIQAVPDIFKGVKFSKVNLSKEADKAFRELARAQQSGDPEMYMEFAQKALREYESGPALTYAMEHVGDLTHRMGQYGNEYPQYEFGIEYVAPKVRTGLRVVTNPVDAERIAKLPDDPTLKNYADAHAKLKVYNEAQRAARDAAVSLGRKDLKEAERNLLILQKMIDNGTYVEVAGSYDPNYEDNSKKLSKVNINKLDPADYMPRDFLPISTINLLHRAQGPGLSERFKGGYRNKLEAGRYIQSLYEAMREEVRKRGGNLPTDMTAQNDENADLISDVLTGEAVAALQKADNAIGWYDAKLKAAKRVMALIHPEILTNPEMEAAFDAAIAITSNGMAVVDNFREGLRQYEYYKKHKRFQEVGTGDQGSAMATHFARLNYILKELGVKDANRFLVTEYTVGELRRMGWPISGENVDTKVYGSFIFGPKIGQGFYQNLRGNYDPLTMDRWFMRMWNRITGNPFKTPKSEERMLENRLNIKREILNDKEISKVDRKIIDEAGKLFFGKTKFKGLVKSLNPNTDAGAEKLDNFVKAIERRYQSYYTKFNKEKTDKALKPEKSDLMKAIGTHVDNVNGELQEDPRNGTEREYIRQVVSRAIDKLGRLGIKINTADFQALVWYPEKQLWRERFGVKPGRGEDNDYADAAKIVAKEKGISDAKIQNALSAGNRKGVGAAVNAGRGVPGSSAKPQESLRKGFTGKQKEQLTEELKKRKLFSAVDVGVPLSPELQEAFNNSFAPRVQKSFFESLTDLFTGDSLLRMTTNIFDKDAINLFTEERLNGQRLTGAYSATVAVHMARRAGTVGAAAIFNGVAPVQFKEKGNILSAYIRSANPGENKDAIAKFMAPIYKNGLQKQFALYGIAKRAKSKPGMKIVNMDEAQIDAAIRLGNQHPEVKEAFEAYQRHNRNLINMVVESGRIAPEEADAMLEDLNYYGAYRVYKDEAYTPKTGGSIGSGSKIEKLSGMSDEKILDDPIEIMIRNQMFWINAAMKNIAAIKSANLAVTAQEAKLVKGDVPAGAYTMVAYENGKKKTYMFEGPRAAIWYTSLRATDKIDWSGAMKYLGLPARVLRASVTHDPGFILANLFRDAFSTWGLRGEKVAPWETFFSFAESLKGSTALDAMRAFGIGGGYDEAMKDPETQAKMVAGKLSPGVHMMSNPFSLVKGLMGRLESLSEASDAATRLAVFKKVMEETGDEAEAAYRALEIMNFSKQGASSVVQIISQLVPFFNAGLQGKYVLSKGLYALGKGVSRGGFETLTPEERRLGVGVLYRGAMMSALALALEQLCGGDDQYEDRVAPYQRETSFIIPLKYFGMPGTFVSIPKPFEFGTMFATIPVAFYRYATNPNESGADLTRTMTTQMSTNFGINVIPPIFVPFIEQYFNTDLYTGQPLVGRGKQSLDPSLQYNSSTGEFSKMLGNKKVFYNVESGEWEGIPPIFVQNYIQSFGGPLGSYLLLAADAATAGSGVETLKASTPITKYPVIRRFLIDAKEQNPVGADTLYKMIGKIDEVNRTLAYYKKIGDIEGYKEYVQEKMPLIKNKGAIKALADVQKELRDRDTAINESKKLTPDEKRDELRKVNDIEAKYLNEIRRLKMELGM